MTPEELIPSEARAFVGREVEVEEDLEIEKGAVRRFARVIGAKDRLYLDEEYARRKGYRSLVAPPTFLVNGMPWAAVLQEAVPRLRGAFTGLHGGDEWEFLEPVQAGDVIKRRGKLIDIYQKEGKTGKLVFLITEITFTNQRQQVAAIYRATEVFRLQEEGQEAPYS